MYNGLQNFDHALTEVLNSSKILQNWDIYDCKFPIWIKQGNAI